MASILATLFLALAFLVLAVLYLVTLQKTLKAVSPANRKMEPGLVWLTVIPFFGLVWQFVITSKIANSIQAEFDARGIPVERRPTYGIGMTTCILLAIGALLFWLPSINSIINIIGMVCWVLYWIKVTEYKKRLLALPPIDLNDSLIFSDINHS